MNPQIPLIETDIPAPFKLILLSGPGMPCRSANRRSCPQGLAVPLTNFDRFLFPCVQMHNHAGVRRDYLVNHDEVVIVGHLVVDRRLRNTIIPTIIVNCYPTND